MINIHHLGISQSERILWLCEELGLPYTITKHVRDPVIAPASLEAVPGNETGKAPFIEDTTADITLSESGAICEYILGRYAPDSKLRLGSEDEGFADYLYWFHYANATLQPAMLVSMFLKLSDASEGDGMRAFAAQRMEASYKLIDQRLGKAKWLAGEAFTAADIMTVYCLTTQRYFGPQQSYKGFPNIVRYLRDVAARPAFQRAMEKGDPEMHVLIDEEPPEQSLLAVGGTTSDVWKKK